MENLVAKIITRIQVFKVIKEINNICARIARQTINRRDCTTIIRVILRDRTTKWLT